jgi:hypothetical protein
MLALTAAGCHVQGWWRIEGVHSAGSLDLYCVDLQTNDVSFDQARYALAATLGNPSGWTAAGNLSFSGATVECNDTVERQLYRIEFVIRDNGDNGPCIRAACARDDDDCDQHNDHCDHDKTFVNLQANHIFNVGLMNHEVGHTVGFKDSAITYSPSAEASTCVVLLDGIRAPVMSIMHAQNAGYCKNVNVELPTIYDLASFEINVAPY